MWFPPARVGVAQPEAQPKRRPVLDTVDFTHTIDQEIIEEQLPSSHGPG